MRFKLEVIHKCYMGRIYCNVRFVLKYRLEASIVIFSAVAAGTRAVLDYSAGRECINYMVGNTYAI